MMPSRFVKEAKTYAEKKMTIISELRLKEIISESIKQVLNEDKSYANEVRFGKWRCIVGGAYYDIDGKGKCRGIRMYIDTSSKDNTTYFLFRRQDNKKYFYCTIVTDSKRGATETKFEPMPYLKVPREIRRDFLHPHL